MNLPPSVLTKKQARTFRHDGTNVRGGPETIIATVRYDDECGNGHKTFAITANIYGPHVYRGEETVTHKSGRKLWQFSGGCCHDEVARAFPELAPLIKWHLCSSDGPMHYVANTVFLAGDRELDAARRTAIWPEATDAELCQEPEVLKAALLARLPALMAEFKAAVESLGFTY